MEWTFTIGNIQEIAREFLGIYKSPSIFAIHGEMGAGKTTFIKSLCEAIGVGDTASSPTFSIINEYLLYNNSGGKKVGTKVYHIDLYRLKDANEAVRAGVEDVLYNGFTCFVEWPERAPEIFPRGTLHVFIKALNDKTRLLKSPDI